MTREQARIKARELRQIAIGYARIEHDTRRSFGVRYEATVLREEAEEKAAECDAIFEREVAR